MPHPRSPPKIPKAVQVEVFERDRWLCCSCLRPVIFPPALKYVEHFMRARGFTGPLAYYQLNWRRDTAPLLDELAASIDHVKAFSIGGDHSVSNFATICARCNARKGALTAERHLERTAPHKVKGKYGPPTQWDGLSKLFLLLVSDYPHAATVSEKEWAAALNAYAPSKITE